MIKNHRKLILMIFTLDESSKISINHILTYNFYFKNKLQIKNNKLIITKNK